MTSLSLLAAVRGILVARRRRRWQSTQATVVRHDARLVGSGPGGGYYAYMHKYAIASYTDSRGSEHVLEVPEQATGSRVPILVHPGRPARACTDDDFETIGFSVALTIAAITGLLLILLPPPWTSN
jgi:hypothetical protein